VRLNPHLRVLFGSGMIADDATLPSWRSCHTHPRRGSGFSLGRTHFAKCGGFLPQSRQRLYSAGRPSVTYSFGSRNPKRIISFLQKVHQSQSLPRRLNFALQCRLYYYGLPLAAFNLLLPMARSTESPGRRFFHSGKYKAIHYPP
jgi:hypothetical protein